MHAAIWMFEDTYIIFCNNKKKKMKISEFLIFLIKKMSQIPNWYISRSFFLHYIDIFVNKTYKCHNIFYVFYTPIRQQKRPTSLSYINKNIKRVLNFTQLNNRLNELLAFILNSNIRIIAGYHSNIFVVTVSEVSISFILLFAKMHVSDFHLSLLS